MNMTRKQQATHASKATPQRVESGELGASVPGRFSGAVAIFIMIFIGIWVIKMSISLISDLRHEDESLTELVQKVREDIAKINAKESSWKVTEAEIEISLSVSRNEKDEVDVKAAGGEVSVEQQKAHKLILRIHRAAATTQASTEALAPPLALVPRPLTQGGQDSESMKQGSRPTPGGGADGNRKQRGSHRSSA